MDNFRRCGAVVFFAAFLCVALAVPASAQLIGQPAAFLDQHVFGAGVGGDSSSPHNIHGLGFYSEKINSAGLYSFTRLDVYGGTQAQGSTTLTTTGACQVILQMGRGRATVVGCGTIGLSTGGGNVGNAFTGGGDVLIALGKLSATGEHNYISLGGDQIKNNTGIATNGFSMRVTFSHGMP